MSEGSRREGVSQERPFVSASLSDGHLSRNVSNGRKDFLFEDIYVQQISLIFFMAIRMQ